MEKKAPKRFRPPEAFLRKQEGHASNAVKNVDTGHSQEGKPLDPVRYAKNCVVISCIEGAESDIVISQRHNVWATTRNNTKIAREMWEAYLSAKTKTPPLLVFTSFVTDGNRPVHGIALMQGPPDPEAYIEAQTFAGEAAKEASGEAAVPSNQDDEEEQVSYGSPWTEPGKYGEGFAVRWLIKCTDESTRIFANYKISKARDFTPLREVDALAVINDLKNAASLGSDYLRDDAGLLIFERIREIREREAAEAGKSDGPPKRHRKTATIEYCDGPGVVKNPEEASDTKLSPLYGRPDLEKLFEREVPSRDYYDPNLNSFSAYIYDQDYYDAQTIGDSPDGEGPLDAYNFFHAPVLRLYGVTMEGFSVCVQLRGFVPYFHITAPDSFVDRMIYDRKAFTDAVLDADHQDPKAGTPIYQVATNPSNTALCTAMKDSINKSLLKKLKFFEKQKYGYPYSVFDKETGQWTNVGGKGVEPPCHRIELVRKETMKGWRPHLRWVLKVYMTSTHFVKHAREILESGTFVWLLNSKGEPADGVTAQKYQIFEANIPYVLRYMIDVRLGGCSWITLPKTKYLRWEDPEKHNISRCDIEVIARWNNPIIHDSEDPAWSHHAGVRYIAFDIECAGRAGRFPTADIDDGDPVICVALSVFREHEEKKYRKIGDVLFTWGSCAAIKETNLLCYYTRRSTTPGAIERIREDLTSRSASHNRCGWSRLPDGTIAYWSPNDELTMLKQLFEFITKIARPQFLTGYNIDDFDLPYLIKRATYLGFPEFDSLGWIKSSRARINTKVFESKARGKRELCDIQLPGLVPVDVLKDVMLRWKLRSYTLNAVASHFLKDKDGNSNEVKADVPHQLIGPLWRDTDESRKMVAYYCWKVRLTSPSANPAKNCCLAESMEFSSISLCL